MMRNATQLLKVLLMGLGFLTFWPKSVASQNYNGAMRDIYFGRQPSARAEAMGKSMPAVNADAFGSFYNPAFIGPNNGLYLSTSYTGAYYALEDSDFKYVGVTTPLGRYVVIGLSLFQFNWGFETNSGPTADPFVPTSSIYTLTFATEPMKDLFVGINVNHARNDFGILGKSYPIDLGILKVFHLGDDRNVAQQLSIAISLDNLIGANLVYEGDDIETFRETLPQIFRLGASYKRSWGHHQFNSHDLKTIGILLQGEYQGLLNSKYRNGFRGGIEVSLLDILYVRLGLYHEDVDDFGSLEDNTGELKAFTYGFGIDVPIRMLTKAAYPLILKFDMTRLRPPTYTRQFDDWDKFSVFNLSAVWTFQD